MNKTFVIATMLAVVSAAAMAAPPSPTYIWQTILTEDFNSNPAARGWSFNGVQNTGGQDLLRWNGSSNLAAQWDEANAIGTAQIGYDADWDYYYSYTDSVTPSSYSRSLGTTLTDTDTFRFGVTLNLTSVAQTTEFYQIANFGLYNLANSGNDRTYATPSWSDQVRNAVEFNYFIPEQGGWSLGRNAQPTIFSDNGTLVAGSSTSTEWPTAHTASMLPLNTDLFVEVTYYGNLRRAYATVYTDAAHTQQLVLDGQTIQYWTDALGIGESFSVTDVAMFNWVALDWGSPAFAEGSFDNLYVQQAPEPATLATLALSATGMLLKRRRR